MLDLKHFYADSECRVPTLYRYFFSGKLSSVADPGYPDSKFFPIPDPGSKRFWIPVPDPYQGKYFNNWFFALGNVNGMFIQDPDLDFFTHPGSRLHKDTHNTVIKIEAK